jgi:acetyl esterase
MMNTAIQYPIHPIYQKFCQDYLEQMTALYQGFENSTEEQMYQGILEIRAAADGVARQIPTPETLREEYTWPVGSRNVKVTVFRPLGSENEELPIVLYW